MKEILQMFKPTPLAIIVLVMLELGQFLFLCSTQSTILGGASAQITYSIGPGSLIKITTEPGGRTTYDIRWFVLALNVAVNYACAAVIATGMVWATGLQRPGTAYGLTALAMVGMSFLVAICISKMMWGYYMARPGLMPEIGQIAQVKTIVPIKTKSDANNRPSLVIDTDSTISERIAAGKKDPYYCLDERILIELEQRKLLPVGFDSSMSALPDLYPMVANSGVLVPSESGYDSAARLGGIVVDAITKSGERIIILGLTGGEVSNDHYPYYELLFREQPSGMALVRKQHFFYDVAGMEGAEWYGFWVILAIPAILGGMLLFTLIRIIYRMRSHKPALELQPTAH